MSDERRKRVIDAFAKVWADNGAYPDYRRAIVDAIIRFIDEVSAEKDAEIARLRDMAMLEVYKLNAEIDAARKENK